MAVLVSEISAPHLVRVASDADPHESIVGGEIVNAVRDCFAEGRRKSTCQRARLR